MVFYGVVHTPYDWKGLKYTFHSYQLLLCDNLSLPLVSEPEEDQWLDDASQMRCDTVANSNQ